MPHALGPRWARARIYAYTPSATELSVAAGVFGIGFLVFTLLVKIAVPILYGTFRAETPTPAAVTAVAG